MLMWNLLMIKTVGSIVTKKNMFAVVNRSYEKLARSKGNIWNKRQSDNRDIILVFKTCPEFSEETIVDISKAKCTWPKISTWKTHNRTVDRSWEFYDVLFRIQHSENSPSVLNLFNLFSRENINQDTVGLEFRNLSDLMDHDADRNSD